MYTFDIFGEDRKRKRTLGIRDKQILYARANKKCECCDKPLEFSEIQVGHKRAYSKGGSTTLRNSVCLCYSCNKLQGTDDWNTFLKKMGKAPEKKVQKKAVNKKQTKKRPKRKSTGFGLFDF